MQELFEGLMETTLAYDTDREVLMCHNSLCEKIINRKNKISNSNKVVKRMKLAAAGGTNAHRGKHFQSVQVKSWVLCESHLPIKPNSAIILQFLNIYGPVQSPTSPLLFVTRSGLAPGSLLHSYIYSGWLLHPLYCQQECK